MDREFFADVEQTFQALAGGLVLSSADARLISEWSRAGLPIDVVKAGIASGFERDRSRPIRNLSDLRVDVEKAVKRWQTRRVGQRPAHATSVGAVFDQLKEQFVEFADHPDAVVRQIVREATVGLHSMAELARAGALTDPIEMLDSLAGQLADSAIRQAPVDLAAAFTAGGRTAERRWRAVRTHYRLPPLVIDLGGGW